MADAAAALHDASGLIHAAPNGMDKLPGLSLPEHLLHPGLWVTEIVYFPLATALLAARRAGVAAPWSTAASWPWGRRWARLVPSPASSPMQCA